jgi:hypothetical protein
MTKQSKEKLLDAGWTFLRTQDKPDPANSGKTIYVIKECKEFGVWTESGEKFYTKVERQRRLDLLDSVIEAKVIIENSEHE